MAAHSLISTAGDEDILNSVHSFHSGKHSRNVNNFFKLSGSQQVRRARQLKTREAQRRDALELQKLRQEVVSLRAATKDEEDSSSGLIECSHSLDDVDLDGAKYVHDDLHQIILQKTLHPVEAFISATAAWLTSVMDSQDDVPSSLHLVSIDTDDMAFDDDSDCSYGSVGSQNLAVLVNADSFVHADTVDNANTVGNDVHWVGDMAFGDSYGSVRSPDLEGCSQLEGCSDLEDEDIDKVLCFLDTLIADCPRFGATHARHLRSMARHAMEERSQGGEYMAADDRDLADLCAENIPDFEHMLNSITMEVCGFVLFPECSL